MRKLNDYFINRGTCAIIPISKEVSKVIEFEETFLVNKSTVEIMDESCKYFGSSYKGRLDGSKAILKMNYKLPIVIEDFNTTIFFPTSSPRFDDCIWICLNNIEHYSKNDHGSIITFSKECYLELDISYYSIENQIFRSTMLESLIRKRKNS